MDAGTLADLFPDFTVDDIARAIGNMSADELAALDQLVLQKQHAQRVPPFAQWLPIVSPKFRWDWHYLRYIQQKLALLDKGDITKLALFIPPRHGKSECVTVRFSAYWLEKYPQDRVIVGAYNQTLANKFSRKIRAIVRSRIAISTERKASDDWETPQGGGLRAVGVGGGITGMGGNLIVIDDPIKSREEAESETIREKTWDWYRDDIYTRREPGARMILIQTRWHHDDLGGRILKEEGLLEEGGDWCVVNFPALAEEDDVLGRKVGEALCPERFGETALLDIKKKSARTFISLYQQRPTPAEGELINLSWFKRYRVPPSHFKRIIQSWDTAQKDKEINDPWCCGTWGETEHGYYLLDVVTRHMAYPEGKRTAKNLYLKWLPSVVLIEDKSSGQSLIQELKHEPLANGSHVPVIAIEPEKDKVTRMAVEADTIEAGLVYLPEEADWLADYESEIVQFPQGKHDDRVDMTSQFLKWITAKQKRLFAGYKAAGVKPQPHVETQPAQGPYEDIILPPPPAPNPKPAWTLQDLIAARR